MNTNIQNQQQETLKTILKKIPVESFYSNVLTRKQIANIYDENQDMIKLFPVNEEQVIRMLIVECLRYVNMKVSQLDVLLVTGLNFIEREDLDITPHQLAKKLARENKDINDLDVLNRILAQINTKLPHDLQTKLTPLQKVNILQYLHRLLPVGENIAVEEFKPLSGNATTTTSGNATTTTSGNATTTTAGNATTTTAGNATTTTAGNATTTTAGNATTTTAGNATTTTAGNATTTTAGNATTTTQGATTTTVGNATTTTAGANDNRGRNNNTSNNNNFMKELESVFSSFDLESLKQQGYDLALIANNMFNMEIDDGSYPEQLAAYEAQMRDLKSELIKKNEEEQKHIIRAKYIDTEPELHLDLTNDELHYYDEHSGSLIPLSAVENIEEEGEEMTKKELENILKKHDIPSDEVDDVHRLLKSNELTLSEEKEDNGDNKIFSRNTLIVLGVIGAILIIVMLVLLLN